MAAASLTVSTNVGGYKEWRVYGGNRFDVRCMKHTYEKADFAWIKTKHPKMTREEWETLDLYLNLNKG
ncbi:hypothetical protein P4H82_26785 [Bacillus cereus]|nr:hypothetical protein [Bacillus cereus]MEB9190610.1 hypothetical protein [Bacillus cereus]